ncbi:MAG: Autotransporter adhesin [Labilithrix sp.]|nr:Autotransporter adhesin [Labilithrix sp.]
MRTPRLLAIALLAPVPALTLAVGCSSFGDEQPSQPSDGGPGGDGTAFDQLTFDGPSTEASLDSGPLGPYSSEVLSDTPRVYYRLGEPGATDNASDVSGNAHTGTRIGSLPSTSGAIASDVDPARLFSAGYLKVASGLPSSGTDPVTFEAWIKLDQLVVGTPGIITNEKGSGGIVDGTAFGVEATNQGQNQLVLDRSSGFSGGARAAGGVLSLGAWHHVVAVFDGVAQILYVDGDQVMSSSSAVAVPTVDQGLVVGSRSGGNDIRFPGAMDEVAVYEHALAGERVHAHFMAGRGK